jgi:cholesterol transport system auxiliary component
MSVKLLLGAGCCMLILTACAIGRPIPQATTYIIDPPAATEVPSNLRPPEALRIGSVRVAAPYAGSALIYRLDDVRYVADPYHAFVSDPGSMLASQIADWLDEEGRFGVVGQPGSTRSAPYVLEATVTELYGDFRSGSRPAAVVAAQFALIEESARPKAIYARTIARRVPLPNASPDDLVRGYGTALGQILSEIAPDLSAQMNH